MASEVTKGKIIESLRLITKFDDVTLSLPKNLEFGDLTTSVAMQIAKAKGMPPMEVAGEIISELEKDYEELGIEEMNAAAPGFINIKLSKENHRDTLERILRSSFLEVKAEGLEKINVEYVSANPTGKLHVGHARGAVFGSTLVSLLRRVGHEVCGEYYINDAGVQMNNLGLSLKARYLELLGEAFEIPESGYWGSEIIRIAEELVGEYKDGAKGFENQFFIDYAYDKNMRVIKDDLEKIGVVIENYRSERSLYEGDKIEVMLKKLEKNTYEKDGALWFRTTDFGDDLDRVLIKSDGSYTYLTPDIVYHLDKWERGFSKLINVWGSDHHGYIKRLQAGIEALSGSGDLLEVEVIQMVQLYKNGEVFLMSKRSGESLTIDDLVSEINIDSLRFNMISRSIDSQLDIVIEDVKARDKSNHVYYIQYANARICQVLEKVDLEGEIKADFTSAEVDLIKILGEYEEQILLGAKLRAPHILANYLYKLASEFHKYYNNDKIIQEDADIMQTKLAVIKGIQLVICDGMEILGIGTPEKM